MVPVLYFPRYSKINQYISSRFSRLQIEEETISQIVQEFGLELHGKSWNLPYGRRGSNVGVLTSGGKKVIRRYRKKWKISTINFEHSILSKLADLDCPAPRLNKTPNSGGLVTINDDNFAMFDYIHGKNYSSIYLIRSQKLSLIEKAAAGLAHYHSCLDGFTPAGQHHLGFNSLTGNRHRDLDWQRVKMDELVRNSKDLLDSKDGENLRWLIDNHYRLLEELAELELELVGEELTRAVIHGDYGLHNILFHESGKVIPMDFELARLEWRLSDFVISFLRFRNRKRIYDLEIMRHFIEAYQMENPIPAEEWVLFPKVWQYTMLQFLIQYWNSYFETNRNPVRLDLARDAYKQFKWAASNSGKLIKLMPRP